MHHSSRWCRREKHLKKECIRSFHVQVYYSKYLLEMLVSTAIEEQKRYTLWRDCNEFGFASNVALFKRRKVIYKRSVSERLDKNLNESKVIGAKHFPHFSISKSSQKFRFFFEMYFCWIRFSGNTSWFSRLLFLTQIRCIGFEATYFINRHRVKGGFVEKRDSRKF